MSVRFSGADLRASLNLDHLILQTSIALATIGLLGWPVYATELLSGWFASHAR